MRPHSGPFLSFLAYYNYRGSLRTVSSHRLWWPPQISLFTYYGGLDPYVFFSYDKGATQIISLHSILGPPDHFLRLLYGAPQVSFFSYNMGAPLRSLSLFTIWASTPPQVSVFACYRGPPQISFFHKIYGGPLRSVSPLTIWGPLRLVSLLTIWGPLRSVSVHTFWGPLSDQFFLLLYGAPSDQFLRYYMGVP